MSIKSVLKEIKKPENLDEVKIIKPNKVPFDDIARLKCFQCGIYNRAILCPPYLFETYPQFETIKKTKKFFNSFDRMLIFIFKNDGSKSWLLNKSELSHINLVPKKAKQLKGTEAGQSRAIGKLMRKWSNQFRKKGYKTFPFINGHCDLCAFKCPNRDHPPCRLHGMPSLESCFIDVYQLLKNLDIPFEYPVETFVTGVTGILVRRDNGIP